MVRILVHPEARRWVPNARDVAKIRSWFGPRLDNAAVVLLPRRMANGELGRNSSVDRVAPPYAFRAFTRGNVSRVFVDWTEAPESVAFLIAHELCHQLINKSPTVKAALQDAAAPGVPWGDLFHELDAEERFCDGIARNILGYSFDRSWWRKRVNLMTRPPESYGGFKLYRRKWEQPGFKFGD